MSSLSLVLPLAFLLVFIPACTLVSASKPVLVLNTVQHSKSADEGSFTYYVNFTSVQKPTVIWTKENTVLESRDEFDPASGQGSTSATIAKHVLVYNDKVILKIGDLGAQYFTLQFRLDGGIGDKTRTLNLPVTAVSPGTDLPYTPGSNVETRVEYRQRRGNGVEFLSTMLMFTLVFLDPSNDHVTELRPAFLAERDDLSVQITKTESEGGAVNVHTLNIGTTLPQGHVNGYLHASARSVGLYDSPLYNIWEHVILSIHEEQYQGPLPDKSVFVEMEIPRPVCYPGDASCTIFCRAYGNDVQSLELFKEEEDGSRTPVSSGAGMGDTEYELNMLHYVDATNNYGGNYVCVGKGKAGTTDEKTDTVTQISKMARVVGVKKESLTRKTKKVTCTAEGTGPLNVTFRGLTAESNGVISLTPGGPSPEGVDEEVSASITMDTSYRRHVYCKAQNLANEHLKFVLL